MFFKGCFKVYSMRQITRSYVVIDEISSTFRWFFTIICFVTAKQNTFETSAYHLMISFKKL